MTGTRKLLDRLVPYLRSYQDRPAAQNWNPRLSALLSDEIEIYGVVDGLPELELCGRIPLEPDEEQRVSQERESLFRDGEHNGPYAILVAPPRAEDISPSRPTHLRAWTLDWATLKVLRQAGKSKHVVSAGALVVCRESRTILYHRRTAKSVTYGTGNPLHTIGGAYQPPNIFQGGSDDGGSLLATAQREVHEETKACIPCDRVPPVLLSREKGTDFFQCILLGAPISTAQLLRTKPNWEAGQDLVPMPFDSLPRRLSDPGGWVPTGRAITLAWLAHGAPSAGWHPKFNGRTPHRVVDDVVGA